MSGDTSGRRAVLQAAKELSRHEHTWKQISVSFGGGRPGTTETTWRCSVCGERRTTEGTVTHGIG